MHLVCARCRVQEDDPVDDVLAATGDQTLRTRRVCLRRQEGRNQLWSNCRKPNLGIGFVVIAPLAMLENPR